MPVRFALNLAMAALFCVAAIMLVPAALGFHRYVILTGSMTGTYDAGSIVFDRPVPTSSLKVGDPITYAPPPGASASHDVITHRIYRIVAAADGRRVFQTKGDFNRAPDNWRFVLSQPTQDRVSFHIPYAGFAFEFLSVPKYRKIVIGLPAVLVAMWVLAGLWRDGGEAQRRRARGVAPWSADVGHSLPQLERVQPASFADALATVRVARTWPPPARSRRRDNAPASPSPWPGSGRARVALPPAFVARTRGQRARPARTLPAGWRLRIRRRAL